jgi:hypothetical protein
LPGLQRDGTIVTFVIQGYAELCRELPQCAEFRQLGINAK